jgi:hypothetical protein
VPAASACNSLLGRGGLDVRYFYFEKVFFFLIENVFQILFKENILQIRQARALYACIHTLT